MKTDWFTLSEARVQFPAYTQPHLEMAVAAMISPAGPRLAGQHGLGMLSLGATTGAGYMGLAKAWDICEEEAARNGRTVARDNWRLVAPMHIADTREQAIENVMKQFLSGELKDEKGEVIARHPPSDRLLAQLIGGYFQEFKPGRADDVPADVLLPETADLTQLEDHELETLERLLVKAGADDVGPRKD